MERGTVIRSAGYGQACRRCTKAKCRCTLRADGDGCERCHRLKRACQPSESQQRHTADNKQGANGRIAAVEGELGHLVAQLKARQVLTDGERHPDTDTTAAPQEPPASPFGASSSVAPTSSATSSRNESTPLIHHGHVAAPLNTETTADRVEEDDLLLATCLDKFASSMLPCFPFVHFGSRPTVAQLRRDRPLLLRAIVCVAWPFPLEKRTRALELKRTLFEAFHLRQEPHQQKEEETESSSIDLLLALLTYVAWGWDHVHGRGCGLSYLMMPCMSLVGEMFLDRQSPPNLHMANMFDKPRAAIPPTTETRCALLGCFVLSSVVSGFFANMDAMNWTPPMEEALAVLSGEGGEVAFPSHASLVLQVRLRLLSLQASGIYFQSQPHQARQMRPVLPVNPVDMDAEGLLRQLQELRRSASLSSGHLQPGSIPPSHDSSHDNDNVQRRRQCMLAVGACTSALLSIPLSRFLGISFLQWEQLGGCCTTLSLLGDIYDDDGATHGGSVQAIADLPILLDGAIQKLTKAASEALEAEDGTFTLMASRMRALQVKVTGPPIGKAQQSGGMDDPAQRGMESRTATARPFRPSQGPFQNPKIWIDHIFPQ
ncbi:C6 transcription factor [Apiospora sp. TS-2023a]